MKVGRAKHIRCKLNAFDISNFPGANELLCSRRAVAAPSVEMSCETNETWRLEGDSSSSSDSYSEDSDGLPAKKKNGRRNRAESVVSIPPPPPPMPAKEVEIIKPKPVPKQEPIKPKPIARSKNKIDTNSHVGK